MTEDVMEKQATAPAEPPKTGSGKKKLIIIIAAALVLALAGGYFGYTMVIGKSGAKEEAGGHEKAGAEDKVELLSLDPFVMNLAEQGRFLKLSVQFELADKSYQHLAADKVPQLRDAIIILVSSKSYLSISSPEGKFQLKDEVLLRANQTVGKDIFKNLYFTEFVMQ